MYMKFEKHYYTNSAQGYDSAILLIITPNRKIQYIYLKLYGSYNVGSEYLDSQTQFQDNLERISWNMQKYKKVGVKP